jgi:Tol biopolymer transport system component
LHDVFLRWDLALVKLGENGRTLLRDAKITQFPWSPNGRKLVVARSGGDTAGIYVVNLDGSGRHLLSRSKHGDTDAAWSPNGRRIAYVRLGVQSPNPHEGVFGELWIMNVDGTHKRMLERFAPAYVVWSPNSRQLAVVSQGFFELRLLSADGGRARKLRVPEKYVYALSWSADGRSIAVESSKNLFSGSPLLLSVIEAATNHSRVLRRFPNPNGSPNLTSPAWSPNGDELALPFCGNKGKCALYKIRSTGAGFTRLRSLGDRSTAVSSRPWPTVIWR